MTNNRFTLDSNVIIDAHDTSVPSKQALAEAIVRGAAVADCVLTLQSISEFYFVVTRKFRALPAIAANHARRYAAMFPLAAPSPTALDRALDAAEKGRFSFWDAYLLATAAQADCTICLSADMHDGAKLGTITVRRAFDGNGLSKATQALLAP